MATLLDATILQGFAGVFTFLIIFIAVFGVLTMTKSFKLSSGLAALLAFIFGVMTLFSPKAVAVIRVVTPWYTTFFFLLLMLIIGSLFFTGGDASGALFAGGGKGMIAIVVVVGVLIFLVGWITVAEDNSISENMVGDGSNDAPRYVVTEDGEKIPVEQRSTLKDSLLHPAILSVLAVLIIAAAAIGLITK